MVIMYQGRYVLLANLLAQLVQEHQPIACLVYQDIYFIRMIALHNVQMEHIDKIHNA